MLKRKMMALVAAPVVAVLAGGGVAVAQTAGNPAGPAMVQQVSGHHGEGCLGHQVTKATPVTGVAARHHGDHSNRGDHGTCSGQHAQYGQPARAGHGVTEHAHHGDDQGEHHTASDPDN